MIGPDLPPLDRLDGVITTSTSAPTDAEWGDALARALTGSTVGLAFQPIIDLRRRTIVGYEALARFADPVVRAAPDQWFARARVDGVGAELGAVVLARALGHRSSLPKNCFLSVNVDPDQLDASCVVDVLTSTGPLGGVVIELTEHLEWDWSVVGPATQRLRAAGAVLALDDAGSAYAGLAQILQLRPSILKLDRDLVAGLHRDEAKIALIEMMGVFAGRLDAWLVAEGVEDEDEVRCLDRLRVPLVQGFYFARPGPPWNPLSVEANALPAPAAATDEVGLRGLVEPVGALRAGEPASLEWFDDDDRWQPVVDGDGRPCGLIDSDGATSGVVTEALVANLSSSATEVAQRLATARIEPTLPVVVTDDSGRYVGVVPIRRLLARLGTS